MFELMLNKGNHFGVSTPTTFSPSNVLNRLHRFQTDEISQRHMVLLSTTSSKK